MRQLAVVTFMLHIAAFVMGISQFSWWGVGIICFVHFFMAPAIVGEYSGRRFEDMEIDEFKGANRSVVMLTLFRSFFSWVWYILGYGIAALFSG